MVFGKPGVSLCCYDNFAASFRKKDGIFDGLWLGYVDFRKAGHYHVGALEMIDRSCPKDPCSMKSESRGLISLQHVLSMLLFSLYLRANPQGCCWIDAFRIFWELSYKCPWTTWSWLMTKDVLHLAPKNFDLLKGYLGKTKEKNKESKKGCLVALKSKTNCAWSTWSTISYPLDTFRAASDSMVSSASRTSAREICNPVDQPQASDDFCVRLGVLLLWFLLGFLLGLVGTFCKRFKPVRYACVY